MLPPTIDLLDMLARWPEVSEPRIIEYEVDAGLVLMYKIRCDLPKDHFFQIRLRLEAGAIAYSYQLFTTKGVPEFKLSQQDGLPCPFCGGVGAASAELWDNYFSGKA